MKNRYFHSLLISLFIYSILLASSFYFLREDSLAKSSKKNTQTIQRVKVSLVEPLKKTNEVKKQKLQKKIEKVKKVKKQKTKPFKKIVKTKQKKIEKVLASTQKKEIKKQLNKKQKRAAKKVVSKTINKDKDIEAKKIKELQNRYFATISETINKNKSYPRRAVLRNLQDDIKIEFTISKDGELLSFFILDGKKIFHKSAQKAIKESFPLVPPKGVLSSNTKLKLTLAYRLN